MGFLGPVRRPFAVVVVVVGVAAVAVAMPIRDSSQAQVKDN